MKNTKKLTITLLIMFFLSVQASAVLAADNEASAVKYYSGNGVSFNYNGTWGILNIKNKSAETIVAVGDPNSADPVTKNVETYALIQKTKIPTNYTLSNFFAAVVAQWAMKPGYELVLDRPITVNGATYYENVHMENATGTERKVRAVWLENEGMAYILVFTALSEDFDQNKANFDMIVNSFEVL